MTEYSVAFVGTGPDPDTPVWGESAAMAHRHGAGYRKLDNCDLVACADLVRENGVSGLASTGEKAIVDCHNRLVGTEGEIGIKFWDGPDLAVRRANGSKETFDFEGSTPLHDAIAHVVESLDSGTEPVLGASNALRSIEVIFGVWESARRRGVVEFPLDIEDNPLEAMVESGELAPEPADE